MIVLIHGFLGNPADWDFLKQDSFFQKKDLQALDLKEHRYPSIHDWGVHFLKYFSVKKVEAVIGYSLGGRLAMSIAKADPGFAKRWIFIAANPGLQNEKEKQMRYQADLAWKKRFESEPLHKVLQDWNAQEVFKNSVKVPERLISDSERSYLGSQLQNYSLGQQESYWDFSGERALYVAGENDSKYCELGKKWNQQNPRIQFKALKKSGHRVLFDAPDSLKDSISDELNS